MPESVPPPVTDVPTAVALFVGYTETAVRDGRDLTNTPIRVRSLAEYEACFGGDFTLTPDAVELAPDHAGGVVVRRLGRPFLYDSVRLFFDNGGRDCRVVSVGRFGKAANRGALERGLDAAAASDAAIFAVPDAAALESPDDRAAVYRSLLSCCAASAIRFAILDLPNAPLAGALAAFRDAVGGDGLRDGAAYAPWLVSSYSRTIPGELVAAAAKRLGLPRAAVEAAIAARLAHVPPSGAVAGAYASADGARGVWKAPANIGLLQVSGPVEAIDDALGQSLNVDPASGKSVNAIRQFAGKGTLVWGARTLAGNDQEWRYVPVRRFVAMVEASIERSTAWTVFQPDAQPLWTAVKGQVESYLLQKWRDGALAGAKPEQAFFVKVGLGQTMTSQDVLAGRLVIEVGLAVVRPAEFVIVRVERTVQGP